MKSKNTFYKLRVLHGWIYERKLHFLTFIRRKIYYSMPLGKKVFVLGTPTHKNVGDSAIVLAEINFISRCGISKNNIKEITIDEYKQYPNLVKHSIRKKDIICLLGGGNMGDIWIAEEYFRRCLLEDLMDKNIIIFPQTLDYSDTPKGKQEWEKSKMYYDNKRITLIAREKKSYDLMKAAYPSAKVLLTPDIVLSSNQEDYGIAKQQKREGILFCMRNDREKAISDEVCKELENFIKTNLNYTIIRTDMYSSECISEKTERIEAVRKKMTEFTKVKLVITDRLHGMIFSALTDTPCIVFSNSNCKVKGTYDWINYIPYIQYVETLDEAKKYIPILLRDEKYNFDNEPLRPYFKKIEKILKLTN